MQNLSAVRTLVRTNSKFYHCVDDPNLIYILGQWPSWAAHQDFLASPEREQILSHQTHQLDFVWMLHLDLPQGGSIEKVVPFTAPVLSIARMIFTNPSLQINAYQTIAANHRSNIAHATSPYPLFDGWRIDALRDQAEYVILTGWESVEAHSQFTKSMREASQESASARAHVDVMEVRHARNMEA